MTELTPQKITQEKRREIPIAFLFIYFIFIIAPQLASAQDFDNWLCTLQEETLPSDTTYYATMDKEEIVNVYIERENAVITITCSDPVTQESRQVSLVVSRTKMPPEAPEARMLENAALNRELDRISVMDEMYRQSFNCHSFTLQTLQKLFNFDLGVDVDTWLRNNFDIRSFMRAFGNEITTQKVSQLNLENVEFREGDVVLFIQTFPSDKEGEADIYKEYTTHSGILWQDPKAETKEWLVVGKNGSATMILGSVGATAEYYGLHDDTDRVEIYRMNSGIKLPVGK